MNDTDLMAAVHRAFERYDAPAGLRSSIAQEIGPGRASSAPTHRSRSVVGLRWGVLVAALLIGAAVLLTPGPYTAPPSVFADWQPTPTTPDPAVLAYARASCLYTGSQFVDPGSVVLQDQRGRSAYFLFDHGDTYVNCFIMVDREGRPAAGGASGGGTFDHPELPIETSMTWTRNHLQPENDWAAVIGRAKRATRIDIGLTNGAIVQATVRDGLFVAWWPGNAWVRSIRALSASGDVIGSLESFPPPPG